jgi:hypothetical protein
MFGRKKGIQEGDYVFSSKQDGNYKNIIFGMVSGVDGSKVGISGLIVNPVGLKNKVSQGKAGQRSEEILKSPTPENCIFAFIYRTEHENFNDVIDLDSGSVIPISEKAHSVLDGWIRESLPELINNVLSLPESTEKEEAKRILKRRMETLYDKNLKQNLYSVCRSLKILV